MLKANHQSQQYSLEDSLRLDFPRSIESTKANIGGYKSDAVRLETNTVKVLEGISPMTIGGSSFSERKDAGEAIIATCKKIQGIGPDKIGSYRGFEMSISFDTNNKEYKCHLKGVMTYTTPLGSDPVGNITRIDNVLERIAPSLADAEAKLETLHSQVEKAKSELDKPFPLEAELTAKNARLVELDSLLSLDGKEAPETREGEEQGADAGISDKVLAVKDSTAQLDGDETTPQVPQAPQPQYPKPTPPVPQTATQAPRGDATAAANAEGVREETAPTKPPVKKKSYDER
jgi:hypothetical protein